jgi:hypothetical protein
MEIPIMAHFAELDSNNIVLRVLTLDNSLLENEQGQFIEQLGIDFLKNLYGTNTVWKQTSYNTIAGLYYDPNFEPPPEQKKPPAEDQSKAFRKNFAGIGYLYDLNRDAFINPKPTVSAEDEQYVTFDEFACLWIYSPPIINIEVTRV